MKKYILFLLSAATVMLSQAQTLKECGNTAHDHLLQETVPGYTERRQMIEDFTQKFIEKEMMNGGTRASTIITIPVVVHVVFENDLENITDAQVLSQIDVLNEDLRRLNADAADTPAEFEGVAADFEIEFCLATIDPDGNPTTVCA